LLSKLSQKVFENKNPRSSSGDERGWLPESAVVAHSFGDKRLTDRALIAQHRVVVVVPIIISVIISNEKISCCIMIAVSHPVYKTLSALAPWSTENVSAYWLPRHQRAVPPILIQPLWIRVYYWLASVAGGRVVCQNCVRIGDVKCSGGVEAL
jgi:hypothetical protein